MGAVDDAVIAVETLIVALNQVRTMLAAERASIDTARDALLGKLGTTTNTQVRHAAQATINATRRLAEAADHLRSAVDSANAFATELGPHQFKAGDAEQASAHATVYSAMSQGASDQTHNLTIEETHTYAAVAGAASVLVHPDNKVPLVDNQRLRNIIGALFHGVGNPNQVGDGSAMAAANSEALGGAQVEGQNHLESTAQLRRSLVNFLTTDTIRERGGRKVAVVRSARDVQVANGLIAAIDDAHAGRYTGLGNYCGLGGCQ